LNLSTDPAATEVETLSLHDALPICRRDGERTQTETRMTEKSELPVLLVVEDDEGLQRQLKWAYEGYSVVCASDRAQAIEALRAQDRKSTRLNSSHVAISYAVFCLKK